MSPTRRSVPFFVLSIALTASLVTPAAEPFAPPAAAAAPAAVAPASVAPTTVVMPPLAAKPRKKYKVQGGVTFNNALGTTTQRRAILNKVTRTIRNAPRGSEVRIFSWKIWTYAGVTALIKAHQRGVTVRAIMFEGNTIVEDNPHFWRLKRGLKAGNKSRPKSKRSGARLCAGSCRGTSGTSHSKFFTFSKAGQSKHVYMHTSSNWGDAAATRQWNDMYTIVGNKPVYDTAVRVFDEAWKDKPVKKPWVEKSIDNGKVVFAWGPSTPKAIKNDRVIDTLSKVRCTGATGGAGNANGRTVIRVAPDVMRGGPGMKAAKHLKRLWDAGCDVKVAYTVIGIDVRQHLAGAGGRGPVPMRHLVQDFDGDGIFDRYFHMKTFTVNGRIGKNTEAYFMVQGSANTSGLALHSDETYGYFFDRPAITKRYQNHIDYWFTNFPVVKAVSPTVARRVASGEIDPYAKINADY